MYISNTTRRFSIEIRSPWKDYQMISLIVRQQWSRKWRAAVRQQVITWTSVGQDLRRNMASLGHNELIIQNLFSCVSVMRLWINSWMLIHVQVMISCIFCANPLTEPMLIYFQLDSFDQATKKIQSTYCHFLSRNVSKISLANKASFCRCINELMHINKSHRMPHICVSESSQHWFI